MALPPPSSDVRAVVTGASSGIGKAIARQLAREGHSQIIVARSVNKLNELKAELEAANPTVTIDVRPCDLADATARQELIDELERTDVSILINSAGIATFGKFQDQDPAGERMQFELNATALYELTAVVLPGMLARKSGAICNVGSAAGNTAIPGNATYVGTKAFVNTFTEALHYDLKGTGVHCTLLAPGPVRPDARDDGANEVDEAVPDFLWTSTDECARDTLNALAKNRLRVVPGILSKGMNLASTYVPRRVAAPIIGKFYEGMA
ncbi:mycolate reductase [Corynebacterium ulceribovis]|uniref:mycolate reductase n=1 Tax=Corynebacterium ulceribovis TaxID=487732 RepID=UPI000362E4D7|nr:mycolate reductase [Corynebacterium ulceribovis]